MLVIGASGLLGFKVAELAVEQHFEMFATYNYRPVKLEGCSFFQLDKCNGEDTLALVKKIGPDVVIDTAALHNVDYCEIHRDEAWRNELEITEAIQLLLDNGYSVGYKFVEGWWKDTGTPEDILESNRLVLDELEHEIKGKVEDEASIQGRVYVGEKSIVRRGAVVRGAASIGKNSMVEANVYIGPYTSIGNNVVMKRGEVENSIIMDNCLIKVDQKITDSLIGPYSVIITDRLGKPKGCRFVMGERSKITI